VRAPSLEPGPQLWERPSPDHVGDANKQNKTERHQDIALTGRHRTHLSACFSQSVLSRLAFDDADGDNSFSSRGGAG
jgi:hypothetical protein